MSKALFPNVNETPAKLRVISGWTLRIKADASTGYASGDIMFHHVYARILSCKLGGKNV